jgi:HAD superfamily hydrolase (TIGR01509 family)
MDGVLLDSEPLHFRALNRALAAYGREITFAHFAEYVGTTVQHTWDDLAGRLGLSGPTASYIADYDRELLAVLREPVTPNPGLLPLLEALERRGVPFAVASSSQPAWIAATLGGLGLTARFPVAVSGADVARGKPDPAIYLAAAARLGVAAARCLAVEDAPAGVASARAAGMRVVALRTPYIPPEELGEADRVIDSLEAFPLEWVGG